MHSSSSKIEVRLSHLTGQDARAALTDNPVILLPMGSHEDQGPHFPMGDYLFAERIAELAASHAHSSGTPTYVAPVLPYGGEDFFRSAMGGIVLEQSTLTAVIHDMLSSLITNGLTRIIMVNGHSGNVNPIAVAMRQIHRETGVVVPSLYLWEAAYGMLPGIVGAEDAARRSGHGADPLGSVGLHLMPELIRLNYRPAQKSMKKDPTWGLPFTNLGKASLNGIDIGLPQDFAEVFNDGVAGGDPFLCDAATGEELTRRLVETLSDLSQLLLNRVS
jgi:creatinine amidohydrolase